MKYLYKYFIARHPKNPFRRKGISLNITPSFLCNYNCSYCAVNYEGKKPINCETAKAHEWIHYIEHYKEKVAEIDLSGGEPTLLSYFAFLCNSLLDMGYYVLVYSNISRPEEFLKVRPSRRFIVIATYHKEFTTAKEFTENYNIIKKVHQINAYEFKPKELDYSELMDFSTEEEMKRRFGLRIPPDMQNVYKNCFEMVEGEGIKMQNEKTI